MKVKILNYKKIRSGSWYRKIFPKKIVEVEENEIVGPFDMGSEEEKKFFKVEMEMSQEKLDEYFVSYTLFSTRSKRPCFTNF